MLYGNKFLLILFISFYKQVNCCELVAIKSMVVKKHVTISMPCEFSEKKKNLITLMNYILVHK